MMTDPIADMLTRIRNAQAARKDVVRIPLSKIKRRIAEILKSEGYVTDVRTDEETKPAVLEITLKYEGRIPAIQSLRRESTPGHRMYRKMEELPKILNGYGIAIISTSQGLMTNKQAKELGIGGEIVCSVF